jgi:uncharacterized protein YceH (UPF0502 family)
VAGDLNATEVRVLGCLIEKQRTTPDAYPLSLNALRLACNQSTNRDPVVDYDEATVREAVQRLSRRGWARLASGAGSRASKYRQLIEEALALGPDEIALLAVLMLRGPQTPGELNQRAERLHRFGGLAAVGEAIERLIERELVVDLGRRPGQKETRFGQLIGAPADGDAPDPSTEPADAGPRADSDGLGEGGAELEPQIVGDERLARLEREVAELRAELAEVRAELGADQR